MEQGSGPMNPPVSTGGKPDLIVFIADQLRFDMLGAYNATQPDGAGALAQQGMRLTPKLDILAKRSAVFERHFTPCPLCLPAKASIFSGLYPRQHGAIINGFFARERPFGVVKRGVELLPATLAKAGYRVQYAGVQHVRTDPPLAQQAPGIEFLGPGGPTDHHQELAKRGLYLGDLSGFRNPVIDYDKGRPVVHSAMSARTGIFPLREDLFYDCAVTDKVVEALEKLGPSTRRAPIALFVLFWLPHPPLWAPRKFAEMIAPESVKLPATVGRFYAGQPALQLANIPGQLGAHVTLEQWQKVWATYMGMVHLLDHCVGRVLASLDHWSLFDEAAIVFTADHGDMLGSHGLFQKNCLYDEAVRVPLLVKLPGQSAARRVSELTDHLDLCATIADLTGVDAPRHSSGRSLRPLCAASSTQPGSGELSHGNRRYVFSAYDGNAGRGFFHRMVRTRSHKFIHNIGDRPELYDLVEDPYETHNVAGNESNRQVETELRTALREWMTRVEDNQPLP